MLRRLLAATAEAAVSAGDKRALIAVTWPAVLELACFLVAVWAAGQAAHAAGVTSLVGELLAGAALGPPLAAFPPFPFALALLGELGLILSIVEAGLRVQLGVVRVRSDAKSRRWCSDSHDSLLSESPRAAGGHSRRLRGRRRLPPAPLPRRLRGGAPAPEDAR